ncbi:MAG: beta-N-acetylhexosaminidase [Alphaproteobacteria bacterium]|nr:beta-N-acetylhexosaminidase [Alphaproteobacteria bacterium]
MRPHAFIASCVGHVLSCEEKTFMKEACPWGLILFKRNIGTPAQVKALTRLFRDTVGWEAPVLIDQEGGRVARLRPPSWPSFPAAKLFGNLYKDDEFLALEAVRLETLLMGHELFELGIDIDCMPVLDLFLEGASSVIGDRAYSSFPEAISRLGRSACEGLLQSGVLPVLKHCPGHGRALVDSHKSLPFVDASALVLEEIDFLPFRNLSDMPLSMCAHVVYSAFDTERPATLSPVVISEVIRSYIGFDGLLITDDISMNALSGSLAERSRAAWAAGCDIVLYSSGNLREMRSIADIAPLVEGKAMARSNLALSRRNQGREMPVDIEALRVRYEALISRSFQAQV